MDTLADFARTDSEHLDVLIVGAGLSGIGAAWHLQDKCPGKSYAIVEARETSGGTWDLFRYPGIRSDSDLHTFVYAFKPWTDDRAIADGQDGVILKRLDAPYDAAIECSGRASAMEACLRLLGPAGTLVLSGTSMERPGWDPLRILLLELVVFGGGVVALWAADAHTLAAGLGALVVLHLGFTFLLDQRRAGRRYDHHGGQ